MKTPYRIGTHTKNNITPNSQVSHDHGIKQAHTCAMCRQEISTHILWPRTVATLIDGAVDAECSRLIASTAVAAAVHAVHHNCVSACMVATVQLTGAAAVP